MKYHSFVIIVLVFLWSVFNSAVFSQNTIWQNCYGGSDFEYVYSSLEISDGGFILCGSSSSMDGDVIGIHEGADVWIEKTDADGKLIWQKCLGGNGMDAGRAIQRTLDGNFIIAGSSNSTNGDITDNHGDYDAWIIKIDTTGNIIWQKSLGGTGIDEAYSIQSTNDGGYFITGTTNSNDGDVTGNHGAFDFWIVKLDSIGNFVWQKCFGGSSEDFGSYGILTEDNGYLVTGLTRSTDGDVIGNHGNDDIWTIKLDSNLDLDWQKCLGGSAEDVGTCIQQTAEGGFILLGVTASNDGDITGNKGSSDFWFVRLTASGEIDWQKCYGSIAMDWPYSLEITADGGYLGAGTAGYNDGGGCAGDFNGWIIKLDSAGNLVWEKDLGGLSVEEVHSVHQTSDGGYFASGFTFSNDEFVQGNHGLSDSWAVKLTGTLKVPVFTFESSTSVTEITFTITAKPGATIYYTTDGTAPDPVSSLYGASPLILTTPGSTGTYIYKAIAYETGWITSDVATNPFTIIPTGIAENQDNQTKILVYPNPADKFIRISSSELTEISIKILNTAGQTILNVQPIDGDHFVDISFYPKGIYFLKITGKEKQSRKLVEKTASVVIR